MATPGPQSLKNAMISPAASDLGLGDSLQSQLDNQLAERRKRLQQGPAQPGVSPFSSVSSVSDLLGQFMNGGSGA